MKKLLSRRVVVGAVLLAVILFLVRPPASWLREKAAQSIAQALGRNAEISSLRLRFLPRPGFALENLVVHDTPLFGAEPLLRAPEVTAWLRIGALLRGHIEISSLSLEDASLNLTRNSDGQWNLEDLMERTSHKVLAPTGAGRGRPRAAFPYIEASGARINFKIGIEKTHFALTDSDFALWQESENTWGVRLKAAPIRTDANLTDTGTLTVSGIWQRAWMANQTPINFSFRWDKAQIGQVSKLVYGIDKGWRGGARVSGSVLGTPEHLKIAADASLDGFRRQDILGSGDLLMSAHCAAEYDSLSRTISDLDCLAPSGAGGLEFKGNASIPNSGSRPFSSYDFWLVADQVPAESALLLARHAYTSFTDDVTASGTLNAAVEFTREVPDAELQLKGEGRADDLQLISSNGVEVPLGSVPFRLLSTEAAPISRRHDGLLQRKKTGSAAPQLGRIPAEAARLELGPVNLSGEKSAALTARASLSLHGYEGFVRGDDKLKHLLQLAGMFGIPAPSVAADGHATVDFAIANIWAGTERPSVTGTARLHSVHAQVRGLNAPLELSSADMAITNEAVSVKTFSASTAGVLWKGSLDIPRPCRRPDECAIQFNLHAVQVSAAGLNKLLNPALATKSWYGFLSRGVGEQSYLLRVRAQGKVAIDQLLLGKASCSHFAGTLHLDSGKVALSNFRAQVLNGRTNGDWSVDFTSSPPKYAGVGALEDVSLADVTGLTNDTWVNGSGSVKYEFNADGSNLNDVLSSAELKAQFAVVNSRFPHIVLRVDSGPLLAQSFSGTVNLNDGKFSTQNAKLETANGVYTVSGMVSLRGALNLKMVSENAAGFNITGTLQKTRVTTVPTAQASLKP